MENKSLKIVSVIMTESRNSKKMAIDYRLITSQHNAENLASCVASMSGGH